MSPLFGVSGEVVELFITEVEAAVEGDVLRYTNRQRLIARAGALGIKRFDANLLIASALHARKPLRPVPETSSTMAQMMILAVLTAGLAFAVKLFL